MVTDSWAAKPPEDLLAAQLQAIDAWNRARETTAHGHQSHADSREQRLEAARRLDALKREQDALLRRAAEQMTHTQQLLRTARPRAVVAHRQAWFRERLETRFSYQDTDIVASVDDGAEAIAATICDQPDLLLIEELLPSVTGLEVLRRVREYASDTKVAVQTMNGASMGALLDAGATLVCSRRIPPHVMADQLLDCLFHRRSGARLV